MRISKDALQHLSMFVVSPLDKFKLSMCDKNFHKWLKDIINIDEWNYYTINEAIEESEKRGFDDLVKHFTDKVFSDTYHRQPETFDPNQRRELITIMSTLMTEQDLIERSCHKARSAHKVFEWLSVNTWFMVSQEKFTIVVKNKLIEWQKDSLAKDILRDFGWMSEANFEATN